MHLKAQVLLRCQLTQDLPPHRQVFDIQCIQVNFFPVLSTSTQEATGRLGLHQTRINLSEGRSEKHGDTASAMCMPLTHIRAKTRSTLPPTQVLHPLLPAHSSPYLEENIPLSGMQTKPFSIAKGTFSHRHTEQGIFLTSVSLVQLLLCAYSHIQSLAVCTHICPQYTHPFNKQACRQMCSYTHTPPPGGAPGIER